MKGVLFNAILLVGGAALSVLWILIFWRGFRDEGLEPYGKIESSDPILAGPYGQGAADRFSANELHALNKHLERLLAVLEEIRGRIGE